jgi:hypothetical protein
MRWPRIVCAAAVRGWQSQLGLEGRPILGMGCVLLIDSKVTCGRWPDVSDDSSAVMSMGNSKKDEENCRIAMAGLVVKPPPPPADTEISMRW